MTSRMKSLFATLLLGLALTACGGAGAAATPTIVPATATAVMPTPTVPATAAPRKTSTAALGLVLPIPGSSTTPCYQLAPGMPVPGPERVPKTPGVAATVTALAVAPAVDAQGLPLGAKTDFTSEETVCIAYTVVNISPGNKLYVRLSRDGVDASVTGPTRGFGDPFAVVNGVYAYPQPQPGTYRIELILNDAATPSRTITFTVR